MRGDAPRSRHPDSDERGDVGLRQPCSGLRGDAELRHAVSDRRELEPGFRHDSDAEPRGYERSDGALPQLRDVPRVAPPEFRQP